MEESVNLKMLSQVEERMPFVFNDKGAVYYKVGRYVGGNPERILGWVCGSEDRAGRITNLFVVDGDRPVILP